MASRVNSRPFPRIERHQGLSLPNEEHCLLANNYQYGKLNEGLVNESETVGKKRKTNGEDLQPQTPQTKNKSVKREEINVDELAAEIAAQFDAELDAEKPNNVPSVDSSDSDQKEKTIAAKGKHDGSNGNHAEENTLILSKDGVINQLT
eukprot:g2875.t1